MKKNRAVIVILALSLLLTACDTFAQMEYYPFYRSNKWYCAEINFEFNYPRGENGRILPCQITPLEWNGKIYNVSTGFMASSIRLSTDEDGDGGWSAILSGSWRYEGKNLVVYSFEGSIFGDAFTELIFVPQ